MASSNLLAIAFNLLAMASSNLLAIAFQPTSDGLLQPTSDGLSRNSKTCKEKHNSSTSFHLLEIPASNSN